MYTYHVACFLLTTPRQVQVYAAGATVKKGKEQVTFNVMLMSLRRAFFKIYCYGC